MLAIYCLINVHVKGLLNQIPPYQAVKIILVV